MIDDKFNASGSQDENRHLAEDYRDQIKKIEIIADLGRREQLYEQIKAIERQRQELQTKAKQLEEDAVQETIRQKVANKHEAHLRPIYASPHSPRQQESFIRHNIRKSLGSRLDKQQDNLRSSQIENLDNAIEQTHSVSHSRPKEKQARFSENADDITKKMQERASERQEMRSRTRTTGHTRTRRR